MKKSEKRIVGGSLERKMKKKKDMANSKDYSLSRKKRKTGGSFKNGFAHPKVGKKKKKPYTKVSNVGDKTAVVPKQIVFSRSDAFGQYLPELIF